MSARIIMGRNRIRTVSTFTAAMMAAVLVTSSVKGTPETDLTTALIALKNHITGVAPLTDAQIASNKLTVDAQVALFGSSATVMTNAFDLVRTFDNVRGPLWVVQVLPKRDAVINDLNWTIFTVMQDIMDKTYTSANIATHEALLNGFTFGSSANFPGACAPPANPNLIVTATINADFPNTWGWPVMQEDLPARKPTGTYLAPGSIATITVPSSMVGKGYKIRVGCHTWDYSVKPDIRRLDRVSREYTITALQTKVANPLGGGIYIEVPANMTGQGIVNVQIKNAVRSPFFSATSFHQTSVTEWQNTERKFLAPWADFQSDKYMMQVPTSWIYALEDPVTLMANWDAAADTFNDLMGFPHDRGRETMYDQVDLLLRGSAYFPGYPTGNNTYTPGANYGGYANHYLVRGPQFAPNYQFHEHGHGFLFPKFPGEVEAEVNLPHVAIWHQRFGYSLDEALRKSRIGYTDYATLDTTAIAWMMCFNFQNGVAMAQVEKQYQLKGHAKFVEIARLFGWAKVNQFWASFTSDYENNIARPTDVDSLLLRLSKAVGVDVRPLFHFWGVPPVNNTTLGAAIAAANLPASPEIYDTLVHYMTLVPANNAAFQTFAYNWWGRQPLVSGYTEENNHAQQWSTYNEASCTAVKARAQAITDLYFPGARPAKAPLATLQAENATLSGAQVVSNNPGYHGTGYVDYLNASGDSITWTVNVPSAGTYDLSFRYALAGSRPLSLTVNGSLKVASLAFPTTGSWSTWMNVTSRQTLNEGNNTVKLTAIGSSGGNIDELIVTAFNNPPVANAQSVMVAEDTTKGITLSGSDPDGDALLYTLVSRPSHGTLTYATPNLTYTPAANYSGSDAFTFLVTDSKGAPSATATVSITVIANEAPVANAQSVSTGPNMAKALTLTGSDVDGNALTYAIVTQPAHGTLSGTAPNVTYMPSAGYSGSDAFSFKVNDGWGDSATATVSIRIAGAGPAGYIWCSGEGGTSVFTDTVDVAYGANGIFSYKYGVTGSVTFNPGTFGGDPVPNVFKAGYYRVALSSPWQTRDIGAVGLTGYVNYSNPTYTVIGSGADIWGASDQFRFVYQTGTGDCTITARVKSMTSPNIWAKAGVMIRNNLVDDARVVACLVTPGNGVTAQCRASTAGTTVYTAKDGVAPRWVRVKRTGDTFTGYRSSDGTTWNEIATYTVVMGTSVNIGLAVSSHDNTQTCTAEFDSVTVTP